MEVFLGETLIAKDVQIEQLGKTITDYALRRDGMLPPPQTIPIAGAAFRDILRQLTEQDVNYKIVSVQALASGASKPAAISADWQHRTVKASQEYELQLFPENKRWWSPTLRFTYLADGQIKTNARAIQFHQTRGTYLIQLPKGWTSNHIKSSGLADLSQQRSENLLPFSAKEWIYWPAYTVRGAGLVEERVFDGPIPAQQQAQQQPCPGPYYFFVIVNSQGTP
ncbi:MAG: hypothetical protein AB7S38_14775 [Vulcanimicrobiota bacterium]